MIRTPRRGERYATVTTCPKCGGAMEFSKNYDARDEHPLPDTFACRECEHEEVAEVEDR